VGALLDDAAVLHHHDQVGALDGRQAVRDHEGGAAGHQGVERGLHRAFGFVVERRRGLVQDQDRRILVDRARDRHALALAAGQAHAVLADIRGRRLPAGAPPRRPGGPLRWPPARRA
jgi:hypothetical protein